MKAQLWSSELANYFASAFLGWGVKHVGRLEDEQVQAERMSSVWKMLTVVKGSDVLELMAENRSPGGLGSGHGERQLFFGERKSLEQMSWGMKWPVSACCDRILSSTMFILEYSKPMLSRVIDGEDSGSSGYFKASKV